MNKSKDKDKSRKQELKRELNDVTTQLNETLTAFCTIHEEATKGIEALANLYEKIGKIVAEHVPEKHEQEKQSPHTDTILTNKIV